ncbi:hypothetical protein LP414_27490 [Polaromonas sp. P1(28)-13]|nr:hypothetical protein LP414_27490 [Polaromonas sp. P1(28)-13]
MAKFAFVGRDGARITPEDWKAKTADAAYSVVSQYDNGVVQVTLKWVGRVPNPENSYPEYWPVFRILVKNYCADGSLSNDPVDNDKTFPTEVAGKAAYEEFLSKWTACEVDAEGDFMEADNTLTPPKPPDPNKPNTESEELGEVGAW